MQACKVVGEVPRQKLLNAIEQGDQLWMTTRKEIGVLYPLTER